MHRLFAAVVAPLVEAVGPCTIVEVGAGTGRLTRHLLGLRLTPWAAVREFESRSGVLTAVEDFVGESDLDWTLVEVPGFHGVVVLAEVRLLEERPAVVATLERSGSGRFLNGQARRVEQGRVEALAACRR